MVFTKYLLKYIFKITSENLYAETCKAISLFKLMCGLMKKG